MSAALGLGGLTVGTAAAQDFEAAYAAPDDPAVNLAYAQAAVDAGDLNGAAAALERVLLVDPNRHSARLLYAVVLFRLDDMQGAREQLDLLEPVTLTPLQRAEATRYRQRIAQGRSGLRVNGRLSAAMVFEEDAAGTLTTQFDSTGLPPTSGEGASVVLAARLGVHQDLSGGQGLSAYGSAGAYEKTSLGDVEADVRRGDLEIGLSHQGRLSAWSVGGVVRALELLDEPYMVESGIRARSSWRISTVTSLSISGEAVNQTFDEPIVDAAAPLIGGEDRDGWRYDLNLAVSHRLTPFSSVGLSLGWQDKQADYAPFGYSGPGLRVSFDTRTRRGEYLALAAGAQLLEYDAPDPVFIGPGSVTRKDVRSWARVALGAPISAFTDVGATGDWRQDVNLEAALTYGSRESKAPLADFQSWGAELRLAWRFGADN